MEERKETKQERRNWKRRENNILLVVFCNKLNDHRNTSIFRMLSKQEKKKYYLNY